MTLQQFGLESLSREDRLALAQILWDSVDEPDLASQESVEVFAELERRIALADAHPESGIPWEKVRADARSRWAK